MHSVCGACGFFSPFPTVFVDTADGLEWQSCLVLHVSTLWGESFHHHGSLLTVLEGGIDQSKASLPYIVRHCSGWVVGVSGVQLWQCKEKAFMSFLFRMHLQTPFSRLPIPQHCRRSQGLRTLSLGLCCAAFSKLQIAYACLNCGVYEKFFRLKTFLADHQWFTDHTLWKSVLEYGIGSKGFYTTCYCCIYCNKHVVQQWSSAVISLRLCMPILSMCNSSCKKCRFQKLLNFWISIILFSLLMSLPDPL